MSLETPVVLLTFNRPAQTRLVLSEIAKVKPRELYVISDGPRANCPDDRHKVAETHALFERVAWPCQLRRNDSDENLGCKLRIATGLDWVFEQCEEAIVVEDDCVPSPSFFNFCQRLLKRYRHDERVMSIAGTNFLESPAPGEQSYYFSKYFLCWGWASWRRAWQHFDVNMTTWPAFKSSGGMKWFAASDAEERYWTRIFDDEHAGRIDS